MLNAGGKKMTRAQRKKAKAKAHEALLKKQQEEIQKDAIDYRKVEMDQICEQLEKQLTVEGGEFTIKEIKSDGHCLYRSIADQLSLLNLRPLPSGYGTCAVDDDSKEKKTTVSELRRLTANYLRKHEEDFAPFFLATSDGENTTFPEYCEKVELTAEWGGQLELRALSAVLSRRIDVFSADSAVVRMGQSEESDQNEPLRVSFHRHYFALGEHYNSIIPSSSK